VCDRLPPGLNLDGSLEDWSSDDAIQDGPLVQMLSRTSVHDQQLIRASTPASVYSGWSEENLYVAFKLTGLSKQAAHLSRSFVTYESGRASGEDLCELLMQPIYADGSSGPVLHVVCKPNSTWVERKGDPHRDADAWPEIQGVAVRYFGTLEGQTWRGEVAIPWKTITGDISAARGRPVMLKFNFSQYSAESGESASWAGPVNFGRDDSFTGLLFIRDNRAPGMAGTQQH